MKKLSLDDQLFLNNMNTTRLLLADHVRFLNINCVLTVLQLFKKFIFDTFFQIPFPGN